MLIKQDIINHWVQLAEKDLYDAEKIFNSGSYDWALFIGHLSLEKIIKAIYIQNNDENLPPKIHDLLKIAKLAKISITEVQALFLSRVNDFHLETRYPDYRSRFFKICTREFAYKNLEDIKEFFKWLKSLIK